MKSPTVPRPATELPPTDVPPPTESKSVESKPAAPRPAWAHLSAPAPPKPPTVLGRLIRFTILIAVVAAGWKYYPVWYPWAQKLLTSRTTGAPKPPPRITPVLTAPVVQRDLDLYLNGLGTVTALNTVTVRSRVEGEILNIAFQEGQVVKEGDLLAEIDPRPFESRRDQAKGAVARDEATLNLAKLNLKRQEELLTKSATTQAQYDLQFATVAQAEAVLETNKAVLEDAELQLGYCRIIAPLTGRVGLKLVDRGNMVRANDPNGIVVITQLDPIAVTFTIPQDEIPRVQKRARETNEVVVDAFDREFQTQLASGKLVAIDNQVDAMTGTLRLKAEFKNDNRTLFPNQFVNARLAVETLKNAFVIPSAAVQRGPEGPFVYLAKPDNTVELRIIVTGPSQGTETSIATGLSLGEIVVTDGVDKLQPNAKISYRGAKTAEASPKSGKPADGEAPRGKGGDRPVAEKGKA